MPEISESDNSMWKLKMAHNFLQRSIFSGGYEELLIKEVVDEKSLSSSQCGCSKIVKQDMSAKKVCSSYSKTFKHYLSRG